MTHRFAAMFATLLITTSAQATNVSAHGATFVGLSGLHYSSDFGVAAGHCDRAALDAVVVAAADAAERERANVATIAGNEVAAWMRWKIGREMEPGDRVCIGQALELAAPAQPVLWSEDGVTFEVVPGDEQRTASGICREFVLSAVNQGHRALRHSIACQWQPGVWELADY